MTSVAAPTQLYASADVAREAVRRGVPITPAGVRLAALTGRLPVAATTASGMRLFAVADVERWLLERAARRGLAA